MQASDKHVLFQWQPIRQNLLRAAHKGCYRFPRIRALWRSAEKPGVSLSLAALLLGSLTLFGTSMGQPVSGAKEGRPLNVVFIVIDDLGWMDLAVQGSELYETPNIDRLAAEGLRFTQAYASYPRCVPSRSALMTGRYPARDAWNGYLTLERVTVAEAFKQNGYATGFVGKWHLGDGEYAPENQGFDINIGGGSSGAPPSYFFPYDEANREGNESRIDGMERSGKLSKRRIPDLDQGAPGEYLTDRLTEEAVRFIRDHEGRPFFLELAHYGVHTPIQGKSETTARYEEKLAEMAFSGTPFEVEHASETKRWQDRAEYAAMIHSVDESVGRLVETLDSLGIAGHTAIVFTSDHGGLSTRLQSSDRDLSTSNKPLRAGKGWLYEGGTRVPLIVKWPGVIEGGGETDALVEGVDLYPTMLEVASLPLLPQEHVDGRSFASVLRDPEVQTGKVLHWHSTSNNRSTGDFMATAIRDGKYKLIDFYNLGKVELYDLSKDVGEGNNLADEMPEKAAEMLRRLREWREALGIQPAN